MEMGELRLKAKTKNTKWMWKQKLILNFEP